MNIKNCFIIYFYNLNSRQIMRFKPKIKIHIHGQDLFTDRYNKYIYLYGALKNKNKKYCFYYVCVFLHTCSQ